MEGAAKKALGYFSSGAKGFFGKNLKKRKPPIESEGEENVENCSDNKKAKRGLVPRGLEDISLHQNRFQCVPVLVPLLQEGDAVVLTFPITRFRSKLDTFLAAKGLDAKECLRSKMNTASGRRICLVGTVVRNEPLVNQPWELLRDDANGLDVYANEGGLCITVQTTSGDSNPFVVTIDDLADKQKDINLWTDRHITEFENLHDNFNKMDAEHQVKGLVYMAKEMDPEQQVWMGLQFYK